MKQGDHLSIYCRVCEKATMQEVLSVFHHDYSGGDDRWERYGEVNTGFLRCACNTAQIRIEDHETSGDSLWLDHIPPHPKRTLPNWVDGLPTHIADLLKEVHRAWTHEQKWIVVMGARSLFDMFAMEKIGIDIRGYAMQLEQLQTETYLSKKDVLTLQRALNVGHGATHRAEKPTTSQCEAVLDIMENLLHRLVLVDKADNLPPPPVKNKQAKP